MKKSAIAALYILAAGISPAFAHLNPNDHGSLASGFSHPLFGADHILAMLVVGLWAWQIGGKALWAIPCTFVGTMIVGFALALGGIQLPFVEPAILASIVALGLLVALAIQTPVKIGAVVVGLFALFHGYAHGGEIGSASQISFAIGFAMATALLHAMGVCVGFALGGLFGDKNRMALNVTRMLGGLTLLAGLGMLSA